MREITGTPDIIFPHLGIVIDKLSRVAFTVFGMNVYWYGIFIGIGVSAGLLMAVHEAKRTGQNTEDFFDFAFFAIIASVIGARIYYVIFSWDSYRNDLLSIFNLRKGGLAIYGTVIAATITAYIFTKVKKLKFFKFGDACVFGLVLGQVIGRWGNFFNREAFGGFTDSLFAMQYLNETVEYANIVPQVLDKAVVINGAQYIQVHPTFLYEMLWNIGLFIFMNIYKKHKKFDGEMILIYFIGYGIGRLWVEGMRTDQLMLFGTGLAVSQVLSLILIAVCAALAIYMRRKIKNEPNKDKEPEVI